MNGLRLCKLALLLGMASLLWSGCATRSTMESRKQEYYAAYSQLTPEQKALVEQGQIKVGMPMDAVYIAWGKPTQVITGESAGGKVVTWIYSGTYLQEYSYWGYRGYYGRRWPYGGPTLQHDYYPQNFVQAEVNFENGVVRDWRTLPHP